jgi:selenoprotein W-related protein
MVAEPQPNIITRLPRVEFQYCTGCKWLLRSAWLAQELLQTFQESLGEVALIPENNIGGTFIVRLNGNVIWDRKDESMTSCITADYNSLF